MEDYIIKFIDGGKLLQIDSDEESYEGCPTCNFGSEYINSISFIGTAYKLDVYTSNMYDYAMNMSDVLKIVLNNDTNVTEKEWFDNLEEKFNLLKTQLQEEHPYSDFSMGIERK